MAHITKEQVQHVAHLARLTFTEDEIGTFTKQLEDIISFAEELNELNTDAVEETTHVLDMSNVLRDDLVRDWLTREQALKNAPDQQAGQVKVPAVLDSGDE